MRVNWINVDEKAQPAVACKKSKDKSVDTAA
jgi:hypothetical protein